jgi:hypothetical protein
MIVEPMTDAELEMVEKLLDPAGPHMWSGLKTRYALGIIARLRAAEAERDAAVARAMPEPVLVRTGEEVGALTTGAYRIAAPWQPRRKWILGWRHPPRTWTLLIGTGASGVKDDHIVGSWVQRLPDLPTPTAAQEATHAP